ncbi:Alpha-L-arabinofuranosidase 1 [Hordeum vulgare]|nr:Alpha-L-arabinofuranosidase 1 [Hordeum vulgare]
MLKNPDNPNPNPHEGLHHEDPYRRPTVAYHWDQVSVYTGSSHVRYKCYVNELDTLTAEQVFWRPYEADREYDLNQMCMRDNPYRLKLKPGWTREEWSELVSEYPCAAEGYHAFNMAMRDTGGSQVDYAPMHDELGREFLMCVNDANVALSHPPGGASSERTLRTTLEKFKSRFHKWATMLSCHGAQSVDVFTGGTSRSYRARRCQLTIDDIEEEEEEETAQEHEGMRYIEEEEDEDEEEEEEAEGEVESSEEEEEEVHTRKGKPRREEEGSEVKCT